MDKVLVVDVTKGLHATSSSGNIEVIRSIVTDNRDALNKLNDKLQNSKEF